MKLDPAELQKLSDAELEALNNDMTATRDAIREEQLKIKAEQDRRSALKKLAALSPAERKSLGIEAPAV